MKERHTIIMNIIITTSSFILGFKIYIKQVSYSNDEFNLLFPSAPSPYSMKSPDTVDVQTFSGGTKRAPREEMG